MTGNKMNGILSNAYRETFYKTVPPNIHSLRPTELGYAEVLVDDDKTQVKVDVVSFTVDEILVTTANGDLVVSGEHEDKEDEHGFISRSFTRRFHLPDNSKENELRCCIDIDGVLSVIVPRVSLKEVKMGKVHVIVPEGSYAKHPAYSGGFLGKIMSTLTSHQDRPTTVGVHKTKDHFIVRLELPYFTDEEISVKTSDDFLIVEGKHEAREDGHGFISRIFKRRYHLPLNADKDQVSCILNGGGILTVTVNRMNGERPGHEKVYKVHTAGEFCENGSK